MKRQTRVHPSLFFPIFLTSLISACAVVPSGRGAYTNNALLFNNVARTSDTVNSQDAVFDESDESSQSAFMEDSSSFEAMEEAPNPQEPESELESEPEPDFELEALCGDDVCSLATESCANCIQDCPCGHGSSCIQDQCLTTCGDGFCAPGGEDCGTCPGDCPCPTGSSCESQQCVF